MNTPESITRLVLAAREYAKTNGFEAAMSSEPWRTARAWLDASVPFGTKSEFRRGFLILSARVIDPKHTDEDLQGFVTELTKLIANFMEVPANV